MMDTILRTIFIQHAGLPFSMERLEGNMEMGICGGELRAAIPFLLQQGKLESLKNRSGEVSFRIKEEILPVIANQLVEGIPSYSQFDVELFRESGTTMIYTVLRWLQWIYYNGLPVTAKGTLHHRTVVALQKITPFEDEKLAGLKLNPATQQRMPLGVSFMLDILVQMSVIHLGADGWKIHDNSLQTWLDFDMQTANEKLLHILCKAYVPAQKYQQQAISLITCPAVRKGNYYSAEGILRQLKLTQQQLQPEQETWLSSWVYVLCRCGWLEQGRVGQDSAQILFRWCASIGQHPLPISEEIIVQPDFEILVSPHASLQTRFHLELMTEHLHTDVMSRYRLTKDKYRLALQTGINCKLDQNDLPTNVRLAITDWTKQLETFYEGEGAALTIKLSRNHLQFPNRFVDVESVLPTYQLNDFKPERSQIMPGIHDVPTKWMQEVASYHQSTLRHLIERALIWKIRIELQLVDELIQIIPTAIINEEEEWCIIGVGQSGLKSIQFKQCQGIRLVMPDLIPN
ncbi:hypothetical protein D3C77_360240 [compost metagenome]